MYVPIQSALARAVHPLAAASRSLSVPPYHVVVVGFHDRFFFMIAFSFLWIAPLLRYTSLNP